MSFILLLTLSSRVPARVLLPSVICANRMRPGLVQKQRSLIFILPSKIGDVWAQSKCSFHRRWAGLFCWDLISGEGAAAVLLLPRLRCRASLHTPAATILYWGVCAACLHTAHCHHLESQCRARLLRWGFCCWQSAGGTQVCSAGCGTSAHGTLWASETH